MKGFSRSTVKTSSSPILRPQLHNTVGILTSHFEHLSEIVTNERTGCDALVVASSVLSNAGRHKGVLWRADRGVPEFSSLLPEWKTILSWIVEFGRMSVISRRGMSKLKVLRSYVL